MRMKKKRIWSGFFANLLGVILGILLTFGVNALWQKHEEKKKTREMLILVRNELEINKEWFKREEKYIKKDCYAYKKLLEANKNWTAIPKDTLEYYRFRLNAREFSQLSISAWQIFQKSETIQKMSNKELVIQLTICYNTIDIVRGIIEKYYWTEKENAAKIFELDVYEFLDAVMNNKESICFFNKMDETAFEEIFATIDAYIDYTILLLDRDGYYQYDLDDEFNSFLKARKDSIFQKQDTIENNNHF